MKTISEVRAAFWAENPQYTGDYRVTYRQNDYHCDIRCAFVDWLDHVHRAGIISDSLADRVTL